MSKVGPPCLEKYMDILSTKEMNDPHNYIHSYSNEDITRDKEMASTACSEEIAIRVKWLQMVSKWTSNLAEFMVSLRSAHRRSSVEACGGDDHAARNLCDNVVIPTFKKFAMITGQDKRRADDLVQYLNAADHAGLECDEIDAACRAYTQRVEANYEKALLFMFDPETLVSELTREITPGDREARAQVTAYARLWTAYRPLRKLLGQALGKRVESPFNQYWRSLLDRTGLASLASIHGRMA